MKKEHQDRFGRKLEEWGILLEIELEEGALGRRFQKDLADATRGRLFAERQDDSDV